MTDDEVWETDFESDAFQKMWLLDYILYNADRNSANYLVLDAGKTVKAIDHGFCFANYPLRSGPGFSRDELNMDLLESFTSLANDTLRRSILEDLLKELLSEEEVQACFARLDHLREMADEGEVDVNKFNYWGNSHSEDGA